MLVKEFRRLGDVRHVGGGDDDGMHQFDMPVRADARLQTKIQWVTPFGLMHLRVALLGPILGAGRRGDKGDVRPGVCVQPGRR